MLDKLYQCEHILVKIFKNVSPADRLNLLLVNKGFNELISNVGDLMEGISIVWRSENLNSLGELEEFRNCMLQSKRKYQKLKISRLESLSGFQFLHRFRSVLEINISNLCVSMEEAAKFVNGFPELTKLELGSCGNDFHSNVKINGTKLKQLTCSQAIIHFEDLPVLENLHITPMFMNNPKLILSQIPNILVQLDRLKELHLKTGIEITENFVVSSKFKLKKLNFVVWDRVREYTSFIRAQPDLTHLNICFDAGDQIIQEMVPVMEAILKLEHLEELEIFFADEFEVQDLEDANINVPTNSSIKSFKVYYQVENLIQTSVFLCNMIQRMPNLKTLEIPYSLLFCKADVNLLNNLKLLEKISIKTTTQNSALAELNLPNLLEVSLRFNEPDYQRTHVIDTEKFIKFLRNHPKLKKLKIDGALFEEEVWKCIKDNLRHQENFEFVIDEWILRNSPFLCTDPDIQVENYYRDLVHVRLWLKGTK